jgi:LysR family hydrogen peroxide-inducible transcriptional activator
VRLTDYGELLLPHAHAILRGFADARHSIQALLTDLKGRLVMGSIPTVMPLGSFLNADSDVDQLVENTTAHLVEGLHAGDVDLAILSLPLSGLCAELFREEILLAVPPEHRLARFEAVDLREIQHERLLLLKRLALSSGQRACRVPQGAH